MHIQCFEARSQEFLEELIELQVWWDDDIGEFHVYSLVRVGEARCRRHHNPRLRGFVIKDFLFVAARGIWTSLALLSKFYDRWVRHVYGIFHADSFRSDKLSILSIRRIAPSTISAITCCISKADFSVGALE